MGWVTGKALPVGLAVVLAALFAAGGSLGRRVRTRDHDSIAGYDGLASASQRAGAGRPRVFRDSRTQHPGDCAGASWGHVHRIALALAVARYEDGGDTSALFQFGTIAFFVLCGVTGAALGARTARRRGGRWAAVGAVILAVFVESASLARAGVLLGLTLLFAFFLVNRRMALRAIPWRTMYGGFLGASVLAAAIFLFSAYMRLSGSNAVLVGHVLREKAGVYLVAGHEALAGWLWRSGADDTPIGFYTFTFAFKMLGTRVQQGLFNPVATGFGDTNIFLVYRGLVVDFGLVGAALFVFGTGFAIARIDAPRPSIGTMWIGVCASCMVLYPLVSPFLLLDVRPRRRSLARRHVARGP